MTSYVPRPTRQIHTVRCAQCRRLQGVVTVVRNGESYEKRHIAAQRLLMKDGWQWANSDEDVNLLGEYLAHGSRGLSPIYELLCPTCYVDILNGLLWEHKPRSKS